MRLCCSTLAALTLLACGETHRSGQHPVDIAMGAAPSLTTEASGGSSAGQGMVEVGGASSADAGQAGASLSDAGAPELPVFEDPKPFVGPKWSALKHVAFASEAGGAVCQSSFVGDLDGDGFDELLLLDSTPYDARSYEVFGVLGSAYLFYGRADFPAALSVLDANLIVRGAEAVAQLGDIDGDGHPDAGVGAGCRCENFATNHYCECPAVTGVHALFGGGAQRFAGELRADQVGVHLQPKGLLVSSITAAGDLNGDAAGEFVVGPQLFPGSAALHTPANSAGPSFEVAGLASWVGDVDADGYDDLVSSHREDPSHVATGLFYGGPERLSAGFAQADASFATLGADQRVAAIGDLDGDGYADVALPSPLRTRFLYGKKARWSGAADVDARDFSVISRYGTFAGLTPADLNGDGARDLLISVKVGQRGSLLLVAGSDARLSGDLLVSDAQLVDTGTVPLQADWCLSNAGDLNGDGFEDVAVGLMGGGVWLLLGGPFHD